VLHHINRPNVRRNVGHGKKNLVVEGLEDGTGMASPPLKDKTKLHIWPWRHVKNLIGKLPASED
jgi:hypothetical protein